MTREGDMKELSDVNSRLMDSLLSESYRDDEKKVDLLVRQLSDSIRFQSYPMQEATRFYGTRALRKVVPLAIAAGILLVISLFPPSSRSEALASVNRIIEAERQASIREYTARITRQSRLGERTTQHRLFVNRQDFVMQSVDWFGRDETIWSGRNADELWLVPEFGPVRVRRVNDGDTSIPRIPFLSIGSMLVDVRNHYELALNTSVELNKGGTTFLCDHIIATLNQSPDGQRGTRPFADRVEIFADPVSGVAHRLKFRWRTPNRVGWRGIVAELVGSPDLPKNFFRRTGHHTPDRPVMTSAN